MNVQQFVPSTAYLSSKHQSHISTRGLLNDWTRANCRTLSADEASIYLGYKAKSGGIWFSGHNTQFQFRPDRPWKSEASKRSPKYRTPLGEYDAFLPRHPVEQDYWDAEKLKQACYKIDDHPYLIITEGAFKALCGCSNGLPTIALMGTSMGLTPKKSDVQGKSYLIPTLEKFTRAGFGFIFAYDADAATNPNIVWEQRKLGHQLLKFGVPVRSITAHWEPGSEGETKGMDDFIQKRSIEEFRQLLSKSVTFDDWESSLDSSGGNDNTQFPPPTPKQLARQLAEDYGHIWKFDNDTKTWRLWTGKHWERTDDGNFRTLVKTTIDARNINYKGSSYITDVLSLLTDDLRVKHWDIWDRKRYIAFDDSVLDGLTGQTLGHSPGMGFTSYLPYKHKPLTLSGSDPIDILRDNCPNIYRWMNTAMQGDRQKILKLLAIINGLLKFRFFDLQMFVHLIGKPGSGKGTFIRLLQKIVGRENWKGCKLRNMDDGSTMASIIDKQLVACPDERTASGVGAILSLTGGDAVSYREVYKPASDAFFYGLLIVGSNNPIFVGDTTGLDRRLCLIHFDNPLPTLLRDTKIEAGMDDEISQLIAVSLTLADSAVSQHIQGLGNNQIAEFKLQEWDLKLQTNSVAAHFDDCLIVDPLASTPTGKLYEHYKDWCNTTLKAVSHIKYPKMLSELCNDYLELSSVKWKKSGGRSFFDGLRFRAEGETSPTHSDTLSTLIPQNIPTDTGYNGVSTGLVRGSEPLPNGNYSDLQGLCTPNFSQKTESAIESAIESNAQPVDPSCDLQIEQQQDLEIVLQTPLHPIPLPEPLPDQDSNPITNSVPTPCEPRCTPLTEPELPNPDISIGERVRVSQEYAGRSQFRGKSAQVIKDLGEGLYQVKFEGAGVIVAGRGRVRTADILSQFLELADSLSLLAKPAPTGATPTKRIAPSNLVSPASQSPAQSQPELAPTTAEYKSEATPSDEINVEAEIGDMVGMIRTALSSDPQDVEAVVAIVNEIIKAVRNTVGISSSVIWERLTVEEQAAYIRALNTLSQPEAEF